MPWLDQSYIPFSKKWSPRGYELFHEATGLWLLSTVAARRVGFHFGGPQYTPLYIALVGITTIHTKSTTTRIANTVLDKAGLRWLLSANVTTPQKLMSSMAGTRIPADYATLSPELQEQVRNRLAFSAQIGWYYEEFGMQLDAMVQKNGPMSDFKGLLRILDDCLETYKYDTVARGAELINKPYLALLACMTPSDIRPYAGSTSKFWKDGLFARFAFIAPPEHSRKRDRFPHGEQQIPTEILQALIDWHQRLGIPAVSIEPLYDKTMEHLWSDKGLPAQEYLHQRGFTDAIIQQAQLGYHETTCIEPASSWGIADRPNIEKVWLPRGIVISWFGEQCLWKLNIRRGDKDIEHASRQVKVNGKKPQMRKYVEVQGSADYLYHIDDLVPGLPGLLLESELDVLAAIQGGVRAMVNAMATGSIGRGRTPRALSTLAMAPRVLIGFDVDENGRGDDSALWWLRTLPHATRLRPWVHDVNEMLQQQHDIRTWVALGLEIPVQTVAIEQEEEPQSEHSAQAQDEHQCEGTVRAQDEEPALICSICGAEVEYYSYQGIAYCTQHWTEHILPEQPAPLTSAQEIMVQAERWSELYTDQMVIDLETTGLDPRKNKVVTIAFGVPGRVTIIDMRSYYRTDPAHQQLWREALQYLLHRDVCWIGHNLKFDWSFLAQQFEVKLEQVYDKMLVEKLLYVGSRVSVSLLASAERYGITVTKEQRSWFIDLDTRPSEWISSLPDAQLTYIRQDIEVPYQIYGLQQEAIMHHGLARVVSLEQRTLPAIAAMELRGIGVDVEHWRHILVAKRQQKADLEEQIKQTLGKALASTHPTQETLFGESVLPTVNLSSSEQLMEAFRALGICMPATSKEALQEVAHLHPVIAQVLEWKALEKFESAFGENLLSYVTSAGRIHATFDQLGAASGRVICREPNLQQIPKPTDKNDPYDLRRCFVAPEDHKLLIADLSNIELRILAEVSRDATMLRFFAEGKDLHSETARLMFNLAADIDPKKHLVNGKKARDIAKTINFGLAYGMGRKD